MSSTEFRKHLREVHGPRARKLPGLRKYVQNYPAEDAKRKPPPGDAIVELYGDDRDTMEAAWKGPEGRASDGGGGGRLISLRAIETIGMVTLGLAGTFALAWLRVKKW